MSTLVIDWIGVIFCTVFPIVGLILIFRVIKYRKSGETEKSHNLANRAEIVLGTVMIVLSVFGFCYNLFYFKNPNSNLEEEISSFALGIYLVVLGLRKKF